MSTFDTSTLNARERTLVERTLARMSEEGAPLDEWPEHEVIHCVPAAPGRWFYAWSTEHPDGVGFKRHIFIPRTKLNGQIIPAQEWMECFAHEVGHVDDWFRVDDVMARKIMAVRPYPTGQLWGAKPPWPRAFTQDTPLEWYAEVFSVAFFPHHKRMWKKWKKWATEVRAIRLGNP